MVRANLDEQGINDSDMLEDVDAYEFEELVRNQLPEAINTVHLSAPAYLLSGKHISANDAASIKDPDDGVLTIDISEEVLRLVACQAFDSDIVVCNAIPEYSADGRMQKNKYTRGTPESPKVVIEQSVVMNGNVANTRLYYYTVEEDRPNNQAYLKRFEYIPRYRFIPESTPATVSYGVAEKVVSNVIDQLTGMILSIYGDQKAQLFLQRASFGVAA